MKGATFFAVFLKTWTVSSGLITGQVCQKGLEDILDALEGLDNVTETSVRSLNATGFPDMEALNGVQVWPGSHRVCMELDSSRYCLAVLRVTIVSSRIPIDISLLESVDSAIGLCLPKSCTMEYIPQFVAEFASLHPSTTMLEDYGINATFTATRVQCQARPEEVGLSTKFVVCAGFIAILLGLAVISTLNDFLPADQKLMSSSALLSCFSLRSNARELFSLKQRPKDIHVLHPLRVISTVLIVYCHVVHLDGAMYRARNAKQPWKPFLNEHGNSLYFTFMTTLNLSVDTFFLMSGLLVTRKTLAAADQSSPVQTILTTLISRYMRIMPVYAFVIWLRAALVDDLAPGLLWYSGLEDVVITEASNCANYAWRNLLLINNWFTDASEVCLTIAWYIACLMQFLAFATLLLVTFARHRRALTFAVTLSCLIAIATTFLMAHLLDSSYPVNVFPLETFLNRVASYYTTIYQNSLCRFAPYGLGMLMAIALEQKKSSLSNPFVAVTLLAMGSGLAVMTVILPHFMAISDLFLSLYTSLFRVTWSLGFVLIIFVFFEAQGSSNLNLGLASKVLHSPLWMPLSQLTYCVYLVHFTLINGTFAYLEPPFAMSNYNNVSLLPLFVLASFLLAVLLVLLVEKPAEKMWKLCEQASGLGSPRKP